MADGINEKSYVRDIVAKYPVARQVLETRGINYCCDSTCLLADAAALAMVNPDEVIDELLRVINRPSADSGEIEENWAEVPLDKLLRHILDTHHTYLKHALPRISDLFVKVLKVHVGTKRSTLLSLQQKYQALEQETWDHIMKEEQVLFPAIDAIIRHASSQGNPPLTQIPNIQNPIRQMVLDHAVASATLAEMDRLTSGYILPMDASASFSLLFNELQCLAADFQRHIQLENNILFPRVERLDQALQ